MSPNGAGKTSIFRLIMGEVMRCGNYDFYLTEREIRREQLLASHRRQQEILAKEEWEKTGREQRAA